MTFDDFWALYPRKVAKKDARMAWGKLSAMEQACALDALPRHNDAWRLSGVSVAFTPYPASWIRGERWTDEIDEVSPKGLEWWRTAKGIEERAKAMGIHPKMGETHADLARRIREKA
jgi:hypothetical protein